MTARLIRVWGRLAVLLALAATLAFTVDLGAAFEQIRDAHLVFVLAGLALVQLQTILSALRWQLTARRLGQHIPPARAIGEYYIASFVNLVLPGGIFGDVGRAIRSSASAAPEDAILRRVALRSVVLERLAGQIVFVAIAAGGLVGWPILLGDAAPEGSIKETAAIALVILLAIIALVTFVRLERPGLKRIFADLGTDMQKAWLTGGAWVEQLAINAVIGAGYILLFAACASAIGAPVPIVALSTVIPAVLLTMLIPFSIGGWGVREGAAAALWPLIGLTAANGVATGLLYGLVTLAGSTPGLLILLAGGGRHHGEPSRRA